MPYTEFIDDTHLKGHTINNRDTVDRKLKINVLAVDDNQINRLLISKVLRKWGATVDLAENGIEAIEKLELHRNFDVVLMDIYMPRMGGLEAIKIIRSKSDPYFGNVPIIVLTASMLSDETGGIQSDGINGYLSKPFETSTLYDKLSRYQQQ